MWEGNRAKYRIERIRLCYLKGAVNGKRTLCTFHDRPRFPTKIYVSSTITTQRISPSPTQTPPTRTTFHHQRIFVPSKNITNVTYNSLFHELIILKREKSWQYYQIFTQQRRFGNSKTLSFFLKKDQTKDAFRD